MKFTTYRAGNLDDEMLLTDIIECLRAGYDPFPVLADEKARASYMEAVNRFYSVENCNLSDESMLKVPVGGSWFCLIEDIAPSGYNPEDFVSLNAQQLDKVARGIGTVDIRLCAKPELPAGKIHAVVELLEKGIDVTPYVNPNLNEYKISVLGRFLSNGIDMTIFKESEAILNNLVSYIENAYASIGETVFEFLNHHRGFYEEVALKAPSTFPTFITAQAWGVFDPEKHRGLTPEQLRDLSQQTFEDAKQRVIEEFLTALEKQGIHRGHPTVADAVEMIQNESFETADISIIHDLANQRIREKYLWQFIMMSNWDKDMNYDRDTYYAGMMVLKETGIGPDMYIHSFEEFDRTKREQSRTVFMDRMKEIMIAEMQKKGVKVSEPGIARVDTFTSLYSHFQKIELDKLPVELNIETYDDMLRAILILEYLSKGVDLSQYIPHTLDFKTNDRKGRSRIKYILNNSDYINIYRLVSDIFIQHNINLFSSVTDALTPKPKMTIKWYNITVALVYTTLKYIRNFLDKPQDSAQHKCAEILVDCASQGVFFYENQIRQIYYGILHGVDVSKYVKPKYTSDVMSVVREGLEHGIDLTPYVDSSVAFKGLKQLRYQLRMHTGMMPQSVNIQPPHLQRKQL